MKPDLDVTPEETMRLVEDAEKMQPDRLAELQRFRLREIVGYAKKHSPFYQEKFAHIADDANLADIPSTTRSEATARFGDWLCDRSITLAEVENYLADPNNALSPFKGKYTVLTTSGTTDVPLIILRDQRHNAVNASLLASRFFGGGKLGGIDRLRQPGVKMVGIIAGTGYHSSYLSYLRTKAAYEKIGMGDNILCLAVSMPLQEKVRALNEFQPEVLTGYPSTIGTLAIMQKAGELHIHPLAIATSAEHLSPEILSLAESVFHAPVMNNYCSSEGGEAAFLCPENHMHVNSDWIIVEPVDADMNPVPAGQFSDGILMTNLANLVQPIIRYFISDRIIMSATPCPCGSPFPHISIEGRKEDILEFHGKRGRPVVVEPTILMIEAMHVDGMLSAQFIQRGPEKLEIRWQSVRPENRQETGEDILEKVRRNLSTFGAGNVDVFLSEEPLIVGKTGKIRNVFKDFRE